MVLIHEGKQVTLLLIGAREGKEKRDWGYYYSALTSHYMVFSDSLIKAQKSNSIH